MKYIKKVERVGDASITEHIVEGDYEEVLAIFTEMNAKDAVEYHGTIPPWREGEILNG